MTDSAFPLRNIAYSFYISLVAQSDIKLFRINPTIEVGDVKVSVDGGAFTNITALPIVTPAGSKGVKVDLSNTEMNGDHVLIQFNDASGGQWCDTIVEIRPLDMPLSDAVWESAARTLTQVITPAGEADVVNNTITLRRGDYTSITITGLGNISTRTKLWFTAKLDHKQADQYSIIQMTEAENLTIFNGAPYLTPTDGTLVVDDEILGNVTITLKPIVTSQIGLHRKVYDIQMLTPSGQIVTLVSGILNIAPDVTHAIS